MRQLRSPFAGRTAAAGTSSRVGGDQATADLPRDVHEIRLEIPDQAVFRELLLSYQGLVDGVRQLPRGGSSFLRTTWIWSLERYAVGHVRDSLAAVEGRCSARAALSEPQEADADTEDTRLRAARFAASLPLSASRLRSLWLVASVLVVARLLFAFFGTLTSTNFTGGALGGSNSKGNQLADAASRVADLNLGNISELAKLLLQTSLLDTAYVVTTFGIATYLVLRPFASGAIAFRGVLQSRGPRSRIGFYVAEHELGQRLRLAEREQKALTAVGIRRAREPRIDFAAKACLAAPLLLFAAVNWNQFRTGWNLNSGTAGTFTYTLVQPNRDDALRAIVIGVAVTLRLAWLALAARRSRSRAHTPRYSPRREQTIRAAVLSGAVLVLAAVFGIYALGDHRAPSLWLQAPPLTNQSLHSSELCDRKRACVAIEVRYACDEPCRLKDMRLLNSEDLDSFVRHGLPHRMSGEASAELINDARVSPAKRIGRGEDPLTLSHVPLPTHETRAETQGFSPPQSNWIRRELARGRIITLMAIVEDNAGHTTGYVTDVQRAAHS